MVGWLYLDNVNPDDPGLASCGLEWCAPLVGHCAQADQAWVSTSSGWLQAMIEGLVNDQVPGDIVRMPPVGERGASIFSRAWWMC